MRMIDLPRDLPRGNEIVKNERALARHLVFMLPFQGVKRFLIFSPGALHNSRRFIGASSDGYHFSPISSYPFIHIPFCRENSLPLSLPYTPCPSQRQTLLKQIVLFGNMPAESQSIGVNPDSIFPSIHFSTCLSARKFITSFLALRSLPFAKVDAAKAARSFL